MTLEIRRLERANGLAVVDRIERRRVELRTADAVDPTPVSGDGFAYPVEDAVAVRTDRITLPRSPAVHVYDGEGTPVGTVQEFSSQSLGPGTYVVQFETALKLYLRVDGPLTVDNDGDSTTVSLPEPGRVLLGARRHHGLPAGTITTTGEPRDVMRAVSHFGSALQTRTPRRSYPSLRGHPPAIEVGEAFAVPPSVERPDAGIRVEVPPELGAVYVASPLALYLPAEVVPGDQPRLVTDEGFTHDLGGERGFEWAVERVLTQTFFLDCLVREEITAAETVEQVRLGDRLPFDVDETRELDAAPRLERYLATPYETIEASVPKWKLVAQVDPAPCRVAVLPSLLDDLAVVRTPAPSNAARPDSGAGRGTSTHSGKTPTPGGHRSGGTGDGTERFVEVAPTDAAEQAWVGDGVPIGASKAVPAAFRNRTSRGESDEDPAIVVVCNDEEMLEERDVAGAIYGSREQVPVEVSVHEHLPCQQFREVLRSQVDFLHYVGHIDGDGFGCTDGSVDAADLDAVGVDSFVLNACDSYEQGRALIDRGAIGGVVTLDEVLNSGALRVGETMARLLILGFPLRPSLDIARMRSIVGAQYLVVGDGNFDIAHKRGLVPSVTEVTTRRDGGYDVSITTYPTKYVGLGGIFRPAHGELHDAWHLVGSQLMDYEVDRETLRRHLDREYQPVVLDGELTRSDRVTLRG